MLFASRPNRLRDIATTISEAVGDPGTQAGLRSALLNINATTANVERANRQSRRSHGGFKNIVGDPQLQRDLKETAANLNGTLAATRAAAERVNSLLGGRNPRRARTRQTAAQRLKLRRRMQQRRTARHPDGQRRRRRDRNNADGEDNRAAQASTLPSGVDFTSATLSDAERRRRDRDDAARNFGDLTFNAELFGSPVRAGISALAKATISRCKAALTLAATAWCATACIARNWAWARSIIWAVSRSKATCMTRIAARATFTAASRSRPTWKSLPGARSLAGVQSNSIGVRLRP
jgi:hypothetical protein